MTVGELITQLQRYPDHYKVEVFLSGPERGDLTAELLDVLQFPNEKIVNLELATPLLPL